MTAIDPAEYQTMMLELLDQTSTLMLASLDDAHFPDASLAPYLYYQGSFWIFVSQLSKHTANLLERKKASVLIREEVVKPANPFTLKRASAQCEVDVVEDNKEAILDKMGERLGNTVGLLRQLGDFHLIKLTPVKGQYIAGFGQAFDIDFADLALKHINPARGGS